MPHVQANGIKIYYELHGKGEPLVLIAGFAADRLIWINIIENLAKRYRVLIFDNRGTGESEVPDYPYSIEMLTEDTAALMKALNISQATILGHSMGGMIAQQLAAKYPELINQLILYCTSAKIRTLSFYIFEFNRKLLQQGFAPEFVFENIIPWIFSEKFLKLPNTYDLLIEFIRNKPFYTSYTGFIHQFEALKNFDSKVWLDKIQAPTHIIACENDLLSPVDHAQFLKQKIAHAELTVVSEAAHNFHIEMPEKFCGLVDKILGK